MSAADFAALPASIEGSPLPNNQGFVQGNHFGHHLSRPKRYSQARLAQLYQPGGKPRSQFQASQNNLEDGDDFAKTPEMVHKEIWVHLLAYNLLRNLMWQSAQQARCCPCGFPCRDSTTVQSVQTQLAQATAKTIIASTLPCSMSSVLTSFPCALIAEPRVTKRRPRVFLGCSNLAQSSKLN